MKKLIFLIGIILLVVGAVLFGTNYTKARAAAKEELKTNVIEINDEFQNVDIDIDTSDLTIKKSEDGKTKVECVETEKIKHEVKVEDGKLIVIQHDTRKWAETMFNFLYHDMKVTIYLAETNLNNLQAKVSTGEILIDKDLVFNVGEIKGSTGDVEISAQIKDSLTINLSTGIINLKGINTKNLILKASTGKIVLKNINVEEKISINVSTGDIRLNDVTTAKLNISASTSDIFLTNTIASDDIIIKTSTGDVNFDHSDAATLNVETSTGNIKGSLLTPKTFVVNADTDDVDVPRTNGGFCDITTDTGKVKITIVE